jgi:NTE family protein
MQKIGIALSGGGFRGFAHLGVLQYLFEQGITPSVISGTSVGSLVGVMIAEGYEPEGTFYDGQIHKICK